MLFIRNDKPIQRLNIIQKFNVRNGESKDYKRYIKI